MPFAIPLPIIYLNNFQLLIKVAFFAIRDLNFLVFPFLLLLFYFCQDFYLSVDNAKPVTAGSVG